MLETKLDFSTQGPFWVTEDGQRLTQFAQDIYSTILLTDTPISLYKAAVLLLFSSENTFSNAVRNWLNAGLFVITHYEPPRITRRELVVAQFAKVLFANEAGQTYQVVFDRLHHELAGSGLDKHLGSQLDPAFANRKGRVTLVLDDPWEYDLISLKSKKTSSFWK